jgi:integrase
MDGSILRLNRYSFAYRKRLVRGALELKTFLRTNHLPWQLILKGRSKAVDDILEKFVTERHELKRHSKGSLALVKHAVLFCQVCRPRLRHRLKQTWATLKAWEEQEPGKLRPPLPIAVLMGLVCQARIRSQLASSAHDELKWLVFSALVLVAYFGLLRPGELFALRRKDVELPNHVNLCLPCVTLGIEKPKNYRQLGFRQFATVKHLSTCEWVSWVCSNMRSPDQKLWPHSGADFRKMFKDCCRQLGVLSCNFTPGSLRAGGSTFFFDEQEDIGRLRLLGRWSSIQSLEHYVQSTKGQQMLQKLSPKTVSRLEVLLRQGGFLLQLPDRLLKKLPVGQRLNPPELDLDGPLWQACRRWGRAQATL